MRSFIRPALIGVATLIGFVSSSLSAATVPATGLGQAWPNAADVSASPRFHVYVFEKQGLRYVQVNDVNGTVRGALAVAGNQVIGLPMGVDAEHWAAAAKSSASTPAESVYRDDTVAITVAPQADGSARLLVAAGECDDPSKCSIRGP